MNLEYPSPLVTLVAREEDLVEFTREMISALKFHINEKYNTNIS